MKTSPERSLSDFEGTYRLVRQITHVGTLPAAFTGTACWTRENDRLHYLETGFLTIHGHAPMASERRYVWDADLNVYFDDGRFFHQVPATGGSASHWCDPDQYDVTYIFEHWPQFQVVWRVKGPAKDYVMVTDYQRKST